MSTSDVKDDLPAKYEISVRVEVSKGNESGFRILVADLDELKKELLTRGIYEINIRAHWFNDDLITHKAGVQINNLSEDDFQWLITEEQGEIRELFHRSY